MAKITFGPTVAEARGKTGDTVYTRTRGGAVARALSVAPPPVGEHNLLSATHLDTTAATPPARGSLISGQDATPTWKELTLGANGEVLGSDGTDAKWQTPASAILFAATADATVNDTQLETTIIPAGFGTLVVPANSATIGTSWRVKLTGYITKGTGASNTLQIKAYLGPTLIYTTVSLGLGSTVINYPFWLELAVTCRTTGNPGSLMTQLASLIKVTATSAWFFETPTLAPTTPNTTIDLTFDVTAKFSTNRGGVDKIITTNVTLERLAP